MAKVNNATALECTIIIYNSILIHLGGENTINAKFKNSNINRNKYKYINIYCVYMYTCSHSKREREINRERNGNLTKI